MSSSAMNPGPEDQAPESPLYGVKALVFDMFGTVVDWRSGVARDVAKFLGRHGLRNSGSGDAGLEHAGSAADGEGIDPHAFADAWRARYQPAMEEVRSSRRAFTRLDVLHRENLDAVLDDYGVDPAAFAPAELDELNLAWHRLDPWPDAVAGLRLLASDYIVAPLSNANIRLALDVAKRAGLPWDAILGAEVVRAYKPAPESYLRTAEVLALQPGQVALVAAHNSDLAAARDVGFRTAFVTRPSEHGTGQRTDLEPTEKWDVVATDFIDLADQLVAGSAVSAGGRPERP